MFIPISWCFQALLCAMLTNQEQITVEQVKKILSEEEEDEEEEGSSDSSQACSSEDEDMFEETARVSPPRRWRTRLPALSTQPVSGADWAWLLKRMHKLCMDLCTNYIQMHLDLENSSDEPPPTTRPDSMFFLPLFPSESSTPSTGGHSSRGTPLEDVPRLHMPNTPSSEEEERRRKKEWWESASNKLYTIATDKTIAKLMMEYKKRKQQQQNHGSLTKKAGERMTPESPGPQRPQQLLDQRTMRHSFSAGPELLRQDKRPRSGSTASSHNISLRDSEAQIQVGGMHF